MPILLYHKKTMEGIQTGYEEVKNYVSRWHYLTSRKLKDTHRETVVANKQVQQDWGYKINNHLHFCTLVLINLEMKLKQFHLQ